jgi:hypothetical protein
MMLLRSKLAIFILILGALLLCTVRPRFEGYTSDIVYEPTTYDSASDTSDSMMPNSKNTWSTEPSPPQGVAHDQIPAGEDDLYILKSQIVPPVCPAFPTACPKSKKSADECPACPACERCPEPSYDCKLVPNYESATNLPVPLLNDFSSF